MQNPESVFPERLLAARKSKGLSQEALAELADITRGMIAKYETYSALPTIATLSKLALSLSVSSDYLIGLCDTPQYPAPGISMPLNEATYGLDPVARQQVIELFKGMIADVKELKGADKL